MVKIISKNKYKEILVCKECLMQTTDVFLYNEITPNERRYRCEHCGGYEVVKVKVLKEKINSEDENKEIEDACKICGRLFCSHKYRF